MSTNILRVNENYQSGSIAAFQVASNSMIIGPLPPWEEEGDIGTTMIDRRERAWLKPS
jgi:hypothetical protein